MAGKRTTKRTGTCKSTPAISACTAASDAAAVVVRLPPDCRLAAQAALKRELQEVLYHGEIVLDVACLERVDTAALQLLVLFRRELESQGGTLRWRGASPILDEAASLLGLEQLLNLPARALA